MVIGKNEKAANVAVKVKETEAARTTLTELKGNKNVWYKIHVLIYVLCNIKIDRSSESRVERTVDELYISEPYFTTLEAAFIKATLVETSKNAEDSIDAEVVSNEQVDSATNDFKTVEEVIKKRLNNFYSKRKASGDFRPCGPHDMVPVYLSVFGIPRGGLEDEHFLSRLRRSGLDYLTTDS